MKLYEITGAMHTTLEIFLESEQQDIDKETYDDVMEYLKTELQNKSSNFIKYIRNLQAELEMVTLEVDRLIAIKKQKENKVEALKSYLVTALRSLEVKKIETELGNYGLRESSKVEVIDMNKIPYQFITRKEEITVDKKGLGTFLKEGNELEGARQVKTYSLQIR